MKHRFQELIEELGTTLDIALHVDQLGACSMIFDEKLEVQIDKFGEGDLLIAAFICPLPPGKFRENILLAALRANNHLYPRVGIFGYSERENQLALFQLIDMKDLTGDKIANALAEFVPAGLEWKNSIETKNAAPNEKSDPGGSSPFDPFAIKP